MSNISAIPSTQSPSFLRNIGWAFTLKLLSGKEEPKLTAEAEEFSCHKTDFEAEREAVIPELLHFGHYVQLVRTVVCGGGAAQIIL